MSGRTFYITTAIPYANGAPHIGHAYERIATDAIARFKRLDGYDVLFVTGMDEHGLKMQQTARAKASRRNNSPTAPRRIPGDGRDIEAPTDDFVRTTQARHKRASQAIWEGMRPPATSISSKYSGWYSVRDEAYYDEGELTERPTAAGSRRPARRSNGSRRRAISSGSPPMPIGCSRIMTSIRISSRRKNTRTRSSPS